MESMDGFHAADFCQAQQPLESKAAATRGSVG